MINSVQKIQHNNDVDYLKMSSFTIVNRIEINNNEK